MPHLQHPVEPTADLRVAVDAPDLVQHPLVPHRPRARPPGLRRPVGTRGDPDDCWLQHVADRLDPEPVSVVVDELDYQGNRGSSSRAKKDEAASKISLARSSSFTLR